MASDAQKKFLHPPRVTENRDRPFAGAITPSRRLIRFSPYKPALQSELVEWSDGKHRHVRIAACDANGSSQRKSETALDSNSLIAAKGNYGAITQFEIPKRRCPKGWPDISPGWSDVSLSEQSRNPGTRIPMEQEPRRGDPKSAQGGAM